jgi:hypothetical protein
MEIGIGLGLGVRVLQLVERGDEGLGNVAPADAEAARARGDSRTRGRSDIAKQGSARGNSRRNDVRGSEELRQARALRRCDLHHMTGCNAGPSLVTRLRRRIYFRRKLSL